MKVAPAIRAATLVLVDDDDFVRLSLARALDRSGAFTVIPAEHGARALEILERETVDALLTDLQMPVMDGLTLLGRLLERGRRLPVAVMTGHTLTPELRARLERYGIAATFTKPIEIAFLVDELQRRLHPATVGRIAGITLFGFLQLLEVEQKTGLVVVHSGGRQGRLYFDAGALVHAETRGHDGVQALYEIVAWPDPRLEIFYERRTRKRTVAEPLQHALMEAARLLDEDAAAGTTAAAPAAPEPAAAGPEGAAGMGSAGGAGGAGSAGNAGGAGGGGGAGGAALPADERIEGVLAAAMQVPGALGVALVDGASGMTLAAAGGSPLLDLDLAGGAAADLLRAQVRVLAALGLRDTVEDVMVTLGTQYHLLRFLGPEQTALLYFVLDRERGNLGLARRRLADLARRLAG
jgi:CheY-like chemotaxis protein